MVLGYLWPYLWYAASISCVLHSNRDYHQWWQQTTADRRWTQYYDMMLTHSAVAAELRLFDLSYFQSSYQTLRRRLVSERLRLIKNQSLARLVAGSSGIWCCYELDGLAGVARTGDIR